MPRPDARTWHIFTGEYPPDAGGVADYTHGVAHALAAAGDDVHVWTSGASGTTAGRITVHRTCGTFAGAELAAVGRCIDREMPPGRTLVQWVPHAFGSRGVNLRFPIWLHARSIQRTAPIDVMIHEPFVPFARSAAQCAAAVVQRAMTALVLRAASRIFVGTPAWMEMCAPIAPRLPFEWTPIPTGVPPSATCADADAFRRHLGIAPGARVIGCFGRGGAYQRDVIDAVARELDRRGTHAYVLLIGLGSYDLAAALAARRPAVRVHGTGPMSHQRLSAAIRACDVMAQPYPDGICSRHSSAAALLSHGAAIVTNRGRFTERVWRDAAAVAFVESDDPSTFAGAVVDLLEDRDARARLSASARALHQARFDVRHTVAALRN